MKRIVRWMMWGWITGITLAGVREAEWKRVRENLAQGLPRSAITHLEPIVRGALADRAWAEATKAIGFRITAEADVEGAKPEEKITRLEKELTTAPPEIRPVLELLLANWYWQYFQDNSWRILQRTTTATQPSTDFTTWDLPRLFAEIDLHLRSALEARDYFRSVPVAAWEELLVKGTLPDRYQPTLYDVVVHQALTFYTSGEQSAIKPEDQKELSANEKYAGVVDLFGDVDEFLAGAPQRLASESLAEKALFIYRELMAFHRADRDPSALANADLSRLQWAANTATGTTKDVRYEAALRGFMERWRGDAISALARARLAERLQNRGERVEAHRVAAALPQAHRESQGGKMCLNMVQLIEAPVLSLQTENVWNDPWPGIIVSYRNIPRIHFRAVKFPWETFLEKNWPRPNSLRTEHWKQILHRPVERSWTTTLPPTADFKERTEEVACPRDLPSGFYFILASSAPDFGETDNVVAAAQVWVSDLTIIVRPTAKAIEGLVLDARSGEPISGATVDSWALDEKGVRTALAPATSDELGLFHIESILNRGQLIRARHGNQTVAAEQDFVPSGPVPTEPAYEQTFFFTDRALYRPGQSIQYKGISVRIDTEKDSYATLAGRETTVILRDANDQEVSRARHRSNDRGSFAGSFTAPRDRVMGMMSLQIEDGPRGFRAVRVEEYKRPKFETTVDGPATPARLGEKVNISGRAMAYTGAAIDGAKVVYRVTRQTRWPWWCWWRISLAEGAQQMAHGETVTDADGSFAIHFPANPDPKADPTDAPVFRYEVSVEVTDSAGETRSGSRTIQVGYTTREITLSAPAWQVDSQTINVSVGLRSLDGEPQSGTGVLRVYRLKEPASMVRPKPARVRYWRAAQEEISQSDPSNPDSWALGDVVSEKTFTAGTNGNATVEWSLPRGLYRVMAESAEGGAKPSVARLPLRVLRPDDSNFGLKIPNLVTSPAWSLQPGTEFTALWGTGYGRGRALVEIEHRGKMLARYWTDPARTQQQIRQPVSEAMRGGFTVHTTFVRENRAYLESHRVDVPWTDRNLTLRWETFRSKLQPGQPETWTLVVAPELGAKPSDHLAPELVAALYDASLDQFQRHSWMGPFSFFRQDNSRWQSIFIHGWEEFRPVVGTWKHSFLSTGSSYRRFPEELFGGGSIGRGGALGRMSTRTMSMRAPAPAALAMTPLQDANELYLASSGVAKGAALAPPAVPEPAMATKLDGVTARKNLNETAFFFPQLLADSNGVVRIQFTMPEALTQWRFLGFAHDAHCRSGTLEATTVTAKELMVQPNPPRFLREGDVLEFSVKVSNQGERAQTGAVRLTFNHAFSDQSADAALGNTRPELSFEIPAKESRSFSWRLTVPDGMSYLSYQAVAVGEGVSDGEEGMLPVLPRRVLVTESFPLSIRNAGTRTVQFDKLANSASSGTLRHQGLTVQMVSQPAWYAVMALPYLMEFPHECAEQVFNRYYANAVARYVATSNPRIARIFETWRGSPALDSPLETNEELKSIALLETPWVREAHNQSEARRTVGVLFEPNRVDHELQSALQKLSQMQQGDGRWAWFPGGRPNDFITLYIVTGFGRLRQLGVGVDASPALRALPALDRWFTERHREILRVGKPESNHLSSLVAMYLYGRSFYLKEQPIPAESYAALDYFEGQAAHYWPQLSERQSQGHIALGLKRLGDAETADRIVRSLRERAVTNEEFGMFWRDTEPAVSWDRAPIETQALMIEVFDEVASDARAVEDLKVWLLKQKQTQSWKTTKATADAVYALLRRGANLLGSDALVEVRLGGIDLTPEPGNGNRPDPVPGGKSPEPGTGFFERRFSGDAVKPAMGKIELRKTDPGVAWGGVHWQYFEDVSKIVPHADTPLSLKKQLYRRVNSKSGQVLEEIRGPLSVGDEVVVRIELKTDRDLEFVHLKDARGSGMEPVNVLSSYHYQDGLGYYENTRDTASHFFMDYVPKGTYLFEYPVRVQHRGSYQSGMAEIQCLYAPEFNSHSASMRVDVR